MRFFLVRYTRKYAPGEKMQTVLVKYRACGIVFLVMNLALALIIFFMIYWNRTFEHHMITAITMTAYTFTALTTVDTNTHITTIYPTRSTNTFTKRLNCVKKQVPIYR